jgi:protein SCO1/2
MLRRTLIVLVFLTAGTFHAAAAERLNASVLDQPKTIPNFALVDGGGAAFTQQRLKGHWSLLAIGYTNCTDTCPFTMANLDAVVKAMADRPNPLPAPMVVFVGVDPARDKPVIKRWVAQFNPRFIGITGQVAAINTLVKGIGDFYHLGKPHKDGSYDVVHSGGVSVIDPAGRLRARLLLPMPPKKTAEFLARLMNDGPAIARANGAQ